MIARPTTLILGAGASNPYKFPLGRNLMNQICDHLSPVKQASPQRQVLFDLGQPEDAIDDFWNALRHSDFGSVDEYLEHNPEHMELGKLATAAALIPFEDHDRLFSPSAPLGDHWYKQLGDALDVTADNVSENRVSILTFNYDRSLEEYLLTVTSARRHCNRAEAESVLSTIPIVHLYGTLGDLRENVPQHHEYSAHLSADNVKIAADSMKIIHESEDDTPEFNQAASLLEQSERIYFLGFGYHPTNVRRLRVFNSTWSNEQKERQMVSGTSEGIEPQEWSIIEENTLNGNFHGSRQSMGCSRFLRLFPLVA